MNQGAICCHVGIVIILLVISLNSRGSVSLPLHNDNDLMLRDTIPVEQKQKQPVKDAADPLIKEVPKARKQLKPIAVPPAALPVKVPKIIKPKIVIKKVGVRIS